MAVRPGDTVGILGGGQLARMLALAGARLGLKSHIFAPDADSPAFDVAAAHTIADYGDETALARFAETIAVATYEFENVPAATTAFLCERCPVRPDPAALAASQDRLLEKEFINSLGIATAPFAPVEDAGALARAVATLGRPCILKARRFGYDGKGQVLVREGSDLGAAFRSMGGVPAIVEGTVTFACEVSVIAARGADGAFRAYDVCENLHDHHILSVTKVPARLSQEGARAALDIARRIAEALDYVGVLAVEMFVAAPHASTAGAEALIVNEIAPRVHNSGHWTLDGAVTSQFEQHMRAVCGWPLGSTRRLGAVEMRNLIGSDVHRWDEILRDESAKLHLYGKHVSRPGRKMGHVTRLRSDPTG
ncbi:MAG: 5-(carboxyamino)imidazole ribonucleotide synthase [Methylobacteriaceae bacterium]|nr:5-(carboxyamino)imidazole ribonucleotide synthase [Methylobacteriaceae bacterium]